MRRLGLTTGVALALAWGSTAGAQTGFSSMPGYPTPLPYNNAPGSYVVAPSMPGSGGSYGYVQQNLGGRMGMSPSAYYSANYFTSTPMTPSTGYYGRGVAGPNTANPNAGYAAPGYAAVPAQPTTGYRYAAPGTYYTNPGYTTTYRTRRGGPIRRLFGNR